MILTWAVLQPFRAPNALIDVVDKNANWDNCVALNPSKTEFNAARFVSLIAPGTVYSLIKIYL